MSILQTIKSQIIPNRVMECRVVRGPFRGARFMANPQHSLRYIFGVYEHELNGWLKSAIPRTNLLLDVGANHGYFSFGVMAAWKRLGRTGTVLAFEPQQDAFDCLKNSMAMNAVSDIRFQAEQTFVGDHAAEDMVTLDSVCSRFPAAEHESPMLIKIDVEGAELAVLRGATEQVRNGNMFLIEAHSKALLNQVVDLFSHRGHAHEVFHQRPLPIIGRERRDIENYWVASRL
jgi:hypothetical protein